MIGGSKEASMQVVELMTRNPVTVLADTTLVAVAGLLAQHHINGLPVVDAAGRLIGIVTQGDLLRRAELGTDRKSTFWLTDFLMPSRVQNDYVHTHGRHVREVMTPNPDFVSPDSGLAEVAALMTQKRFRCLPVLEDGVLVGVISRSDLVRALAGELLGAAAASKAGAFSDAAIGQDILRRIAAEKWLPQSGIRVAVAAGTVSLEGIIFSDSERRAVRVLAENTPGVKAVNDHLVFVDAATGMPLMTPM